MAAKFLSAVLANPQVKPLLSDEHFSVDGTLIEAWASMKSFRAKDGSDEPPTRGAMASVTYITRSAATIRMPPPRTQAKLYKKGRGKEAKLCFMGHALMENRHGLVVQAEATRQTARQSARRRWR